MVSLESVTLGVLSLLHLGAGYLFAFRVETALAIQRRYAEAVSWKRPSDDPAYYQETRDHRKGIFQLGGGVLIVVGALLLAVSVYATVFAESFPQ
jgi:hypothetical protein